MCKLKPIWALLQLFALIYSVGYILFLYAVAQESLSLYKGQYNKTEKVKPKFKKQIQRFLLKCIS